MADIPKTLKPGQRMTVRATSPTGTYTSLPLVEVKDGDRIIVSLEGAAPTPGGIIISAAELAALPMSGAGWDQVKAEASKTYTATPLSQAGQVRDSHKVTILGGALFAARTGDAAVRQRVIDALVKITKLPNDPGDVLGMCRTLGTVILAADIVGYRDPAFVSWVDAERKRNYTGGGGGGNLISVHDRRPNNFGGHALMSRVAAAVYLDDRADLDRAATVHKGWLGDRSAYSGFSYNLSEWHVNPPVGINPKGAVLKGLNVDGVIPDDQRRASTSITWPPPKENYVWEGLMGWVPGTELLHRQGYPAYEWSDRAILRAIKWLHEQCNYPAEGDDTATPHLVNARYGTNFPAGLGIGKNIAYLGWLTTNSVP